MIAVGSAVVHLSQIAGLAGTRIAIFGLALVAVVTAGLRAAGRIAQSEEAERRSPPGAGGATRGEAARLREQVIRGARSAWERKDLVGRLRISLRNLERCAAASEEGAADDERQLAALLKAPIHRRTSPAQVKELADSLLASVERWEERLHRRPGGE